jgi:hypothetical protein
MAKEPQDEFDEQETVRRREAALNRMLSTPHKPHKPIGKKKTSPKSGRDKGAPKHK